MKKKSKSRLMLYTALKKRLSQPQNSAFVRELNLKASSKKTLQEQVKVFEVLDAKKTTLNKEQLLDEAFEKNWLTNVSLANFIANHRSNKEFYETAIKRFSPLNQLEIHSQRYDYERFISNVQAAISNNSIKNMNSHAIAIIVKRSFPLNWRIIQTKLANCHGLFDITNQNLPDSTSQDD